MKRLLFIAFLLITQIAYAGNIGGQNIGSQVSFIGQPVVSGGTVTGNDVYATNLWVGGVPYTPVAPGTYVPYTGATSTVNLNSQHIVAGAGEINGTLDIGGTSIASGSISDSSGLIDFATTNVSGIGSISTDGGAFYSDGSGNVIISGTLNSGVTTVSNLYATNLYGKYANTHAVATTLAAGFAPILSGAATDFLNGTGVYSVPGGSGTTGHLHPYYTPLTDYSVHTHPNYSTTTQLGTVANLLGTHQHDVSYPSATQFQTLSQAVGTNAHAAYYADINHQHPTYSTGTQLGTVANLLGTHQHNQSYPSASQFQSLSQVATTNSHSEYVPYTGASSTVNIGSQHFTAKSSEISEMVTGKETINYTAGSDTGQGLAINLSNNNYGVIVSKSGGASTGLYSSTTGSVGTYTNHRFGFFTNNSNDSWSVLTNGNFVSGIDGTGTQNIITAGDITASALYGKIDNTHAVATTTATGFAPILSNVVTEFLNGTGAYSTPAGGAGYNLIQEEGAPQTVRTTINFVGAGATASDVGGVTQVDIPGGGTSSSSGSVVAVFDGGGSAIATGSVVWARIPNNATFTEWDITAFSTSPILVIDVCKSNFVGFDPNHNSHSNIDGTESPTLTNQQERQDTNLTSWITGVTAGSYIYFTVMSVDTATYAVVTVSYTK